MQLAMNYPCTQSSSKHSSSSWGEDILIKRILLTHDPDSHDLDSEMLLRVIEAIMHHATPSQGSAQEDDLDVSGIEVDGALEPPGNSVYKTSCEILCRTNPEKNEDASTLSALKLLGCYRWQDKMLLALLAFATIYGKLWIIVQNRNQNSLAASIAILQQFPNNIDKLKPVFMALAALVKTMVEVIKCVAEFERLPLTYVELEDDMVIATQSLIYLVTYWVVRSTMVCIFLITNLRDIKDEQVHVLSFQLCSKVSSFSIDTSSLRETMDKSNIACYL